MRTENPITDFESFKFKSTLLSNNNNGGTTNTK